MSTELMERSPWQVDFYRCPLINAEGQALWGLVVCNGDRSFEKVIFCPQDRAGSVWVAGQLKNLLAQGKSAGFEPSAILMFRPQAITMVRAAASTLDLEVIETRLTPALKERLKIQAQLMPQLAGYTGELYDPLAVESLPPEPMPEENRAESWRFAALALGDLRSLGERVLIAGNVELLGAIAHWPEDVAIPGVVMYGGQGTLALVRWLEEVKPVSVEFQSGEPHGVILEAGLCDRWVLATFTDEEVYDAGQKFMGRLKGTGGVQFVVVMPDQSDTTVSGLWILAGK